MVDKLFVGSLPSKAIRVIEIQDKLSRYGSSSELNHCTQKCSNDLADACFVLLSLCRLGSAGFKLPGASLLNPNPYRPCLQEFYADWAPEKLGQLDSTLATYEGREKQLFAKLQKKYKQKASYMKCVPVKK